VFIMCLWMQRVAMSGGQQCVGRVVCRQRAGARVTFYLQCYAACFGFYLTRRHTAESGCTYYLTAFMVGVCADSSSLVLP